jgi:hypothetical protein
MEMCQCERLHDILSHLLKHRIQIRLAAPANVRCLASEVECEVLFGYAFRSLESWLGL